jgi:4a-hydroxytetrahydrobiopterin dehydratase
MTSSLIEKECIPCRGSVERLKKDEIESLLQKLDGGWKVVEEHHLEKEFRFKNFRRALYFVNLLGEIAEEEGHHPDILLAWGKVQLKLWTHAASGLTENDFILAAKSDEVFEQMTPEAHK